MRFDDFRSLVARLQRDIPAEFESGIVGVEVSPKTVPHPVLPEIYTLGECIPLEWSGTGTDLHSRIVLYYGSFQALSRLGGGDFDWRAEAWETLTHELRHHLEWRANVTALEAYDWAGEQNFARHEGRRFDPVFYRSGERVAEGVWKVDDDVFLEAGAEFVWHGRRYRAPLAGLRAPAFLTLDGLTDPPPGDAVLVLSKGATLLDLWRRPKVTEAVVRAVPLDG